MRLLTYDDGSGPQVGILQAEEIVSAAALAAPASSLRGLLSALDTTGLTELGRRATEADQRIALADVRLLAPVPDPQKIVCLGLNYRDHAAEAGQEIPAAPMWFAKFANSLIGSGETIMLPIAYPDHVDYEAELAVVIGRAANRVSVQDALSYVAGAMSFNDVTARDLQFENPLWTSGKAIDTFAPCGPALVTLDEVGELQSLELRTRVNGEVLQQGTTANQIFSVAETVAWLSRTMTLLPGDVITTGTPAGVGASKGRFLRDGDTVEVEIEGLSTLANPVRTQSAASASRSAESA
jgi:2-keto-4-pentenoate hydratase/2-oxohepta-3-ene-1,7-dioic acid hydratase in catechol pathway